MRGQVIREAISILLYKEVSNSRGHNHCGVIHRIQHIAGLHMFFYGTLDCIFQTSMSFVSVYGFVYVMFVLTLSTILQLVVVHELQ